MTPCRTSWEFLPTIQKEKEVEQCANVELNVVQPDVLCIARQDLQRVSDYTYAVIMHTVTGSLQVICGTWPVQKSAQHQLLQGKLMHLLASICTITSVYSP